MERSMKHSSHRNRKSTIQRIVCDGDTVAPASREAHVHALTAALPEARIIKSVLDDHTSRVITFELFSDDR
jgi:hypothetical protein